MSHTSIFEKIWQWMLASMSALILIFLVLPILIIVPLSFTESSFLVYPVKGFSLQWYAQLFQADDWSRSIRNSFIVAPVATAMAMLLGVPASLWLSRNEFKGKQILIGLLISPMIVPTVIVGVAMYMIAAPLGMTNSYLTLVLAHTLLGVPFVIITVTATLQGYDWNLNRAALSLGASPLTVFFKITLPITAPGMISGALFAFVTSFDEVVVTLFLAGPSQTTLPLQMFSGIRENISPAIAAAATILVSLSIVMLLTLESLRVRAERMRITTQT